MAVREEETREPVKNWKPAKVIYGDRAGETVLMQPENPRGFCQVLFATGASGWYLRSDLEGQEENHGG